MRFLTTLAVFVRRVALGSDGFAGDGKPAVSQSQADGAVRTILTRIEGKYRGELINFRVPKFL
jgi:hypothetical protein